METRSVNFHFGISSNTSKSRQLEIRGIFHFSCREGPDKSVVDRDMLF